MSSKLVGQSFPHEFVRVIGKSCDCVRIIGNPPSLRPVAGLCGSDGRMGGLETAKDDAAESGEELKVSGFATSATPADGAAAAAAGGKAGGGAPAGFGARPPAGPTAVAGPAASAALGDDRGVPSERSEAIFAWAATTAGVSGNPGVESMPLEREILRSRCRLFWNHTCTWRAETPSFLESSMRVCRPVDARGKGGSRGQPPRKWCAACY
eukprot:jgi/Chrpa1/7529/Chrysochromulina_OHIO_Genome00015175-RA